MKRSGAARKVSQMEFRPLPPERILCTGDVWCHALSGLPGLLEAQLRLEHPAALWRFWHMGEAGISARQLLDEAALRLLARNAQRILISVGHSSRDREATPEVLSDVRALLDLLSDKLPNQAWILLPSPSLWPEAGREAALRLRQELSNAHPAVRRIDAEAEVRAFLEAQDPEHAVSLCQPGPTPTPTGALLLARAVLRAWA